MTTRIAINGMGRIGRLVFRAAAVDPEIEIVAVNASSEVEAIANLLKYDSTQGRFDGVIEVDGECIIVNGQRVQVVHDRVPANLPWAQMDIDVVVEATGAFNDATKAVQHIEAGAKKVLITAPGKNEDFTTVLGVNDELYDKEKHNIVSNASCTTNCLAPVAKVLLENFGIVRGFMNTVHAYTSDQRVLDKNHPKDMRRARSAAVSMVPTTTGAAKAVGKVLPDLVGKLDGTSLRVPTPDGSMVDLTVELGREVTAEEVNAAMKAAAEGPLKGILEYTEDPIVSVDIIGNPASSIFDSQMTTVLGGKGNLVKVVSWYDNEWGYSNRVKDLAIKMMA